MSQGSQPSSAPRILIAATLRWPIAARLAVSFAEMGCQVDVVCPRQHPVGKTRGAVAHTFRYSALRPLASLRSAIESAEPDLVVPCDDDAAVHLQQLYELADDAEPSARALRALIVRSLGAPDAPVLATARGELMALAAMLGVRIPEEAVIGMSDELDAWLGQHGYPCVIKSDRTWGGQGVAIVRNRVEAQRAFHAALSRPGLSHAVTRLLLDRDPSFLLRLVAAPRRTVTVQKFVVGTPANRAVACWEGAVLAGTSVEAIRTQHPTGPATVARVIDNAEMTEAVGRLVQRLGVSGLWGVDFVLEAATGAAYLIEVNPRATPICHLPLGTGRNLPAALYAHWTGRQPASMPTTIDCDTVALFPGEWHRDPGSPFLRSAFLDVPWEQQALIRECLDRPWSERGLIARLWAAVRPKPHRIRGGRTLSRRFEDSPDRISRGAPVSEDCPSARST